MRFINVTLRPNAPYLLSWCADYYKYNMSVFVYLEQLLAPSIRQVQHLKWSKQCDLNRCASQTPFAVKTPEPVCPKYSHHSASKLFSSKTWHSMYFFSNKSPTCFEKRVRIRICGSFFGCFSWIHFPCCFLNKNRMHCISSEMCLGKKSVHDHLHILVFLVAAVRFPGVGFRPFY